MTAWILAVSSGSTDLVPSYQRSWKKHHVVHKELVVPREVDEYMSDS